MALPQLNTASYGPQWSVAKQEVTFRPYLVKEEKVSNDGYGITRSQVKS